MGNYYLDIETTGLEPEECKILTIQWCELERNTGKLIGKLNILKEWESSEKQILEEFVDALNLTDPYPFSFIPIGYNLGFEHKFLSVRSEKHDTFPININSRPHLDLHQLALFINRGEFKGTKLSNMTNKPEDGLVIQNYYRNGQFDKIENYIQLETQQFIQFVQWAFETVPMLLPELRQRFPKPAGK